METSGVLGEGYTGMKDYWKEWAQKSHGSIEDAKLTLLAVIADALEDIVKAIEEKKK